MIAALKTQTRRACAGFGVSGEAGPIIVEYFKRQELAACGVTISAENVNSFTAECFFVIANECHRYEHAQYKKKGKK